MKTEFKETMNILNILNEFKNKNVYPEDEIEEENDNIGDINEIEKRFQISIDRLKSVNKDNYDEVIKNLIDLHLIYSDFIWQYEQMHEMIKKMISEYRNN
ncbi:hypothetical protein [Clostridium sp. ZBS13]|uniref:hypothetical protein n=1 Tax=Clostridium sp. ZBS13 TaxID=2949971 RepID=UPI002079A0A7|nr:hypothetical protein [Clostridium sp. ZBS13]